MAHWRVSLSGSSVGVEREFSAFRVINRQELLLNEVNLEKIDVILLQSDKATSNVITSVVRFPHSYSMMCMVLTYKCDIAYVHLLAAITKKSKNDSVVLR